MRRGPGTRLVDWLDARYDVRRRVLDRLLYRNLPTGSPWWYRFGILALFALVVQVATGWLLLLEFAPTPAEAQPSLRALRSEVAYGWFVQALHVAGASAVVVLGGLYLGAVVLRGLHRRPRELNWVVLVLILGAVGAMAWTGSILPWDDRSIAAATVAHDLTGRIPGIGGRLADWLLGGSPGEATYRRALAFHVAVGPLLMAGLVGLYWRLVRTTGHEPVE